MFGDKTTGKVEDTVKSILDDTLSKVREILGESGTSGDNILGFQSEKGLTAEQLDSVSQFDKDAKIAFISTNVALVKTTLTGPQLKTLLSLPKEPSPVKFFPIGQKTTR